LRFLHAPALERFGLKLDNVQEQLRLCLSRSPHALATAAVNLPAVRGKLAVKLAEARKGWLERLIEAVRRQ
jgi:hypothetical protein